MLQEFRLCMDEATQIKLRSCLRQNPNLSLTDFKQELRAEFGIDTQRQNRREWESVRLELTGPPGHELTLQKWRSFEALYKLHRDSVPERSTGEEWRMLFAKLPPVWQERVVGEQAKKRDKHPWVRLTYPVGLTAEDVLMVVEGHLQGQVPDYREFPGGFVFETPSAEARDQLLQLHNAKVEGRVLFASRHDYEMSGDDIFAFITKRLRTEEELRATREALGCVQPTVVRPVAAQVHAVVTDQAGLQVVQFSGESQTGKSVFGSKTQYPKPADKRRNEETQNQVDRSVCHTCRREGREFCHDFTKCEYFRKAAEELAKRNPSLTNRECRVCQKAGRPADHDWKKCEHVKHRPRWGKESKANDTPAQTPPKPSQ
jgi:hypothetical protein